MTGELEVMFGCDQRISIRASYPVEKRPFHAVPHPSFAVVFEGAKLKLKITSLRIGSWQSCRIAALGNCLCVGRATIGILHYTLSYNGISVKCLIYSVDSQF